MVKIKPYPKEIKERAIELRRQGLQYREIIEALKKEFKIDVPKITIRYWFYFVDLVQYYRPLEERLKLLEIIKQLREEGLSYQKIQTRLKELGYGKVNLDWIKYTLRGVHNPDGRIKKIKRGYELGYTIGAILSDGTIYRRANHKYACILTTKDKEFKTKFTYCVEAIGLKANCYYDKTRNVWKITVYSRMLYNLLATGQWINLMGPEEEAGFLDGFFDGDGGGLMPNFVNTNKKTLKYIQKLLEKRGIRTSPLILVRKSGTMTSNKVKVNNDIYAVYVYPIDYGKFTAVVRTAIQRKQKLIEISKRAIEYHLNEIQNRKDWWEICKLLQKAIGKCIKKSKKQTPVQSSSFKSLFIILPV